MAKVLLYVVVASSVLGAFARLGTKTDEAHGSAFGFGKDDDDGDKENPFGRVGDFIGDVFKGVQRTVECAKQTNLNDWAENAMGMTTQVFDSFFSDGKCENCGGVGQPADCK